MASDEWGDFQTPIALARQVVRRFESQEWGRVLEPTCGTGSFLNASMLLGANIERKGLEIQTCHVNEARTCGLDVVQADIFSTNLATDIVWKADGPLLIVGNPPWVTSAQLGSLGSTNLPDKTNLKKLGGFDAITGASNFDIAEFILLKLMTELQHEQPTLAFLIKTQVARNLISYAEQYRLPYSRYEIRLIDSKAWFGASVDACLFVARYQKQTHYECDIFSDLVSHAPERSMAAIDGRLVSDLAKYRLASEIDGASPLVWRSGVKHDAAGIMELDLETCRELQLEDDYVYPLLKCSDVYQGRLQPVKCVLVPQTVLGEDTSRLQHIAPRLWAYLENHSEALDNRKSSIFVNQPRFSIFGIGSYTFLPYKIAISGLHKTARFALLGPHNGKPILVDDASYLVGFADAQDAAMCYAMLTSRLANALLQSLVFWDSKRPITKKLLQRIDLSAIARRYPVDELIATAREVLNSIDGLVERSWESVLQSLTRSWDGASDSAQLTMVL